MLYFQQLMSQYFDFPNHIAYIEVRSPETRQQVKIVGLRLIQPAESN